MRNLSLTIWVLLALAVLATAAITRLRGHRLSDLIAALRARPIGAIVLAVGWAWIGWHFLVR
ncbi:DUF6186 family protein [Ferrimicrobium sp.]|uniref:DUF6186 family protein n=1 Tax=Ferrimicrobium sp. TaxID=2926050 RepID=UPI0026115EA5|nr:DUF6186 family protein [Ferrimicrobium sp.]